MPNWEAGLAELRGRIERPNGETGLGGRIEKTKWESVVRGRSQRSTDCRDLVERIMRDN